ncbi:MAG: sensor histidine kinase [Jatrophihabitantaceae bacterium]
MWTGVAARRHEAFDVLVAAVLLGAGLVDLYSGVLGGVFPGSRWVHLPFVIAMSVPIAWRRRWPLGTLLVVAIVQSIWLFGLYPLDQQPPFEPFVALLIAVYSASAYSDGHAARAAWVTVGLGVLSDIPSLIEGKPIGNVAGPDVTLLIAFSLGLGFARSRRRADAQERRAAQAEQEATEAADRAAAEERARIARELHDVISHDVSLMVLQASVERRVSPQDSASTAQTLESIEATGREALGELRRMLGVLRKSGESAPLRPQPGLAQLLELVEHARQAGVLVDLSIEGEPAPLPAGVDLAAYRIVQESLTNIVKHAGGSTARVTVRYAVDAVEIDVSNAATTTAAAVPMPTGGHGLLGLRERAVLYGGSFEAGPQSSGGFRVRARVPVAGA